jgi:hypothetical protein
VVKCTSIKGRYRLAISRNGREKVGEEIYEHDISFRTFETESPTGIKTKHKIAVPPYWKKMEEIYIDIYEKNGGTNTVEYKINQPALINELCKQYNKDWRYGYELTRRALFSLFESKYDGVPWFEITSIYPSGDFKETVIKVWNQLTNRDTKNITEDQLQAAG